MAGYQEQYILALIGASGSKKTSVARVMFSLFGEALINFTSTDRAIELAMMNRQDSTLILDDLTSGNNKDLTGKFERILRQLGDSTGRVKSINGGMTQESVRTRCAIVLTAETDIDALSKSSKLRTLSVPVGINSFNSEILAIYQQEAEQSIMLGRASKLEQYMTFYIDHLKRNYREIVNLLHTEKCTIQPNDLTFARQTTIFKILKSQAVILLDFWLKYGMISQEEITVMCKRFLNAITKIMLMNEQRCMEFEPYILFLKAIKEGANNLIARNKEMLNYDGRYIGYWQNEHLILRAELTLNYVVQFYNQRQKLFPESLGSILNKFYEMNLIEVYEQKDHKPKLLKQVKINNISQSVICLKWSVVEMILSRC